ncbi:ABC transporter ATP-binding protein [Oceaniglobus roseus]|uniref:ABC transporter ATP-binding protein n=1 Tax=Oceaniglobus roseus TaxID=1737570 RepID=UPI000C7F21D2|nr:ABC transporter ATP-binding protein [Kandeliimicrobium roseum]
MTQPPRTTPETAPADSPVLRLGALEVGFRGQPVNVLDGVDLEVSAGEILCVVGESGCGKSVSAMALMGLLPPAHTRISSGNLTFDGEQFDLTRQTLPPRLRGGRMAMIFQEPMSSLNPAFRIGDQIAESVLQHQGGTHASAMARALEMLRRVGIPAPDRRLKEYPHQLSGGMRQRVMIAMALANDPQLLIADEPTTALDVTIQAQILDLIRELRDSLGMACLMITHDLGVVAEIADTVAVMYGGQVVERGPAAAVFENPQHPYTIGLISAVPRLDAPGGRLATVPGSVPPIAAMPTGCRFRNRCPFAADICAGKPPLAVQDGGHAVACHFAPLEQNLEVVA